MAGLVWLLVVAVPTFAIDDEGGGAMMEQLSAQEQQEYRQRMGEAKSSKEQQMIENEYQNTVQQRAQLKEGKGNGDRQGGDNRTKGQGKGNPSQEGKAGPYGSKNKPQKGGK
jgi:hypothetical protein